MKPLKIILAGVITGLIAFVPSALIYGALGEYMQANTIHYDGLLKNPPSMLGIITGGISWGIMTAYILSFKQNASAISDFLTGSIVFTLILIGVELYELSTKNLITVGVALAGIGTNILVGGVRGLVAGAILRRFKARQHQIVLQ